MSNPISYHNPASVRMALLSGLILCAVLAPLQSRIWNGTDAPAWVTAAAQALVPSLQGMQAASQSAQPQAVYFFYGRFVLLVYAAVLFALRSLSGVSRIHRGLIALVGVAAFGDFLAYWVSAVAGPSVRNLGFWKIEVPALVAALALATVLGVNALRNGAPSRRSAWCFTLAVPLALLSTASLRYMPHGPLLALLAVLVASVSASSEVPRAAAVRPSSRSRRALAVVAALAVATVFALLPYRPILVAGAAARPGPYTLPAPVAGLRLHVFNTGMNRMSELLVGSVRPWRPAPAFAIEHPTRGLIVFDCGLSAEVERDGEAALPIPMRWLFESRGRPGRTLDAQMREAGLSPADVSTVVISHLHDDHTGVASQFAAASFLGGPGSHGHLANLESRWREIGPGDATKSLAPFDGAYDLFGDGSVEVIPGGGHTREDLMLLLALPEGPVLLAGDAVVHRDWLAGDDVQRIATDGERAAAVRNQLRALLTSDPRVVLFPGHDLGQAPTDRADIVLHHAEWFAAEAWPVSP